MHVAVSGGLGWSRVVSGLGASTSLIPQYFRTYSNYLHCEYYFCVHFAEIRYMEARPSSSLPSAVAPAAIACACFIRYVHGRRGGACSRSGGALFVVGRVVVVASCMCVG